jgi:hypothetical protein
MPDYQKGKIYKLWSPSKNLVYYGSTIQSISQRLTDHINCFNRYKKDNNKRYFISFLVLDCEDYKIELIEEYPCNNKQQLCKKEGEYIKNNECVNKQIAGRTTKEWAEDNKEKIKEQKKEWNKNDYENNPDKHKEKNKLKYEKNKDDRLEKQKKYYKDNIDKRLEYAKNYREAKKNK